MTEATDGRRPSCATGADRADAVFLAQAAQASRLAVALRLALREGPRAGLWLDYGCGGGAFAALLARARPECRVEGWDGDASSLSRAQASFRGDNLTFELRPYDSYRSLPETRFHGIACLEVIEHVDNPGQILRAFHGALKPGGLLVLSTPNVYGWNYLNREFRRLVNKALRRRDNAGYLEVLKLLPYDATTDAGHIGQYSVETLERLLRSQGFRVVAFDTAPASSAPHHRLFADTLVMAARRPDH